MLSAEEVKVLESIQAQCDVLAPIIRDMRTNRFIDEQQEQKMHEILYAVCFRASLKGGLINREAFQSGSELDENELGKLYTEHILLEMNALSDDSKTNMEESYVKLLLQRVTQCATK